MGDPTSAASTPAGPGPSATVRDDAPHESSDPRWTETWYLNAFDLERRRTVWAHVSWLPAQGRGQHTIAVVGPEGARRERVDTHEPLVSDLLTMGIDPWTTMTLRCDALGVDLRWDASHPPIDLGALLHTGDSIQLSHLEAGGRGHGLVGGEPFAGPGFRDRSFGPRNLRGIARHTGLGMLGLDREVFINFQSLLPVDHLLSTSPTVNFTCLFLDGVAQVRTDPVTVWRHRDGSPARFTVGDDLEVEVDLAEAFGEVRFVMDPNSAPATDPSTEHVYQNRNTYLPARSPQHGRLVGWYEEGVLLGN